MTEQRARANEKRLLENDLNTMLERICWFCHHFGVVAPALEFDPGHPEEILVTDELIEWVRAEGACIDWLVCGAVSPALAAYREKHLPGDLASVERVSHTRKRVH
ncbi:hypothetical protein [Pseudoruegeria sp. HB172150]|uniref:hypothetical protein n=1 Tax=Pseudoruegeria sp. HB172150 TaxID=2721164 RepID=UPI0015537C12|nr:hypothetical protein [Pseudoruegeria sp. HB172150]